MARRRLPRATNAALTTVVLLEGEVVYDTVTDQLKVGDGATAGGVSLARESQVDLVAADLVVANTAIMGRATTAALGATDAAVAALDATVDALALGQVTGAVIFATKAAMDAVLTYAANTKAEVYSDATAANNGVYAKIGASGAGSWTRLSDLAVTSQAAALAALDTTLSRTVRSAPTVEYSAITAPYPGTIFVENARTATFTGWGVVYQTPATISFNAVAALAIPRGAVADADKWQRIKFSLLTHATAPLGGDGVLVAESEMIVDPESDRLPGLLLPWYLPGTTTLKSVTQADLNTRFAVAYQAFSGLTGSAHAVAGEARVTRTGGLTKVSSHYMTTGDGQLDPWDPDSAGDDFGFDLIQLTGLVVTQAVTATPALARRLGLPLEDMTLPGPNTPILTPRLFALQGYDAVMYYAGLCSGQGPKLIDIDGGVGLGRDDTDRWHYDAPQGITSAGLPLTVTVLDPDYLSVRGSGSIALHMPAIGVAASAARRVLDIGDSMTNDGRSGTQYLALAAGNAAGVQPTMVGTLGAGANKHEGRPGWTVDAYYQTYQRTDGGVLRTNPFIGAAGQKFNAAYYLSSTGQAAPHRVGWLLGTNDVYAATSDLEVHLIMTDYLDKLDRMIGRIADAAVGSWSEVSATIAHLIGTPIPPAASKTGWSANYAIAQSQQRFKRNIAIAAHRIAEHYRNAEAEHCFVVPYHLAIDTVGGFDAADGLHPNTTGYNQIGNQRYYADNVLVGEGKY